jgi:hypothetical protein
MTFPRSALSLVLAFLLPLGFFLAACGKDNKSLQEPDPTGAVAKVQQANAALEQILYDQLNGPNPDHPDDVDFSEPYGLYNEALGLAPDNLDAHFGVAVTGLLILSADTEVNAAFDEWKAYLDAHTPFEAGSSARAPLGIPIVFRGGSGALHLPYDVITASALALAPIGRFDVDPQIERVQAILEDRVLPKARAAVTHLGRVASNAGYAFIVTPRMQGDEDEEPAEIDRTDILVLRAGCSLLAAACDVAVSYNLGFAAYDSLSLYSALQPGSGWLALRAGGADHMQSARAEILTSIGDLDAGITSLLGETDPQSNDVIKIGPDDLARADVESVQVHLPDVTQALNGGYARVDDWDGDASTPDVRLKIDLGSLFTNPVPDWKALLPPYTASVERRTDNIDWHWGDDTPTITVTVPSAGQYHGEYWITVEDRQRDDIWDGTAFVDELRSLIEAKLALAEAVPGWSGTFYGYAYASGYLQPGEQEVQAHLSWSYETIVGEVFVPVITWDAQSFEQWILPDPTFNGLLPEIGSTGQLWSLFGVDGSNWDRELVLDWTEWDVVQPWPGISRSRR